MPGEQLSLRWTAEALGVSVMPVREAVYQWMADQALEVAPNRSVRVPLMSAEQFKEITKIRLEIEGFAVAQAAQNVPPERITERRAPNERLSAAMEAPGENKAAVVLINKELHFLINTAANIDRKSTRLNSSH